MLKNGTSKDWLATEKTNPKTEGLTLFYSSIVEKMAWLIVVLLLYILKKRWNNASKNKCEQNSLNADQDCSKTKKCVARKTLKTKKIRL